MYNFANPGQHSGSLVRQALSIVQTVGLVGLVLLFNRQTLARIMPSHKKGGKSASRSRKSSAITDHDATYKHFKYRHNIQSRIIHHTNQIYNSSLVCVSPGSASNVLLFVFFSSAFSSPFPLRFLSTAAISSSYTVHSGTCLLALSNFGSFVKGLLHRSIVLASFKLSSEHHVSHHSHSCGKLWIGSTDCM